MSLSQKHSGLVLVPWFNTDEWVSVCDLIYTTPTDWPKALEILKIWKLRTPLLSAGVEGTLIVLEALILNKDTLTNYEISHIYSTSLMRFLNLCATNSDKQGTFYRVALKNELPKWLISLRHEIAHNHKMPSKSMLETSLIFCLDWIKGKYWDVQLDYMIDLVIEEKISVEEEEILPDRKLQDLVYVYLNLNTFSYHNKNFNKLSTSLKRIVYKILKGNRSNPKELTNLFWKKIKEKQNDLKTVEKLIFELLVDKKCLLSVDLDLNSDGEKQIPEDFVDIWLDFLFLLYEIKLLPKLIFQLYEVACESNEKEAEVASLWIKRIFQILIEQKNQKHTNGVNAINEDFLDRVLKNPNKFTRNFFKEMLAFTAAPPAFIEDVENLLRAFTVAEVENNSIFTIDDLPPLAFNDQPTKIKKQKRILDVVPYKFCPLGVLPHQSRKKNPCLQF